MKLFAESSSTGAAGLVLAARPRSATRIPTRKTPS